MYLSGTEEGSPRSPQELMYAGGSGKEEWGITTISFTLYLSPFLGTGQSDILNTALALAQSLAMARRGDNSKGEEMTPPSFLVTLFAEHLPGNWKETSKECGLPECPAKGPSPAPTPSLFPFQNYWQQRVPKTNVSRAY